MVKFEEAIELQKAGFPVENGFQEGELMNFIFAKYPFASIIRGAIILDRASGFTVRNSDTSKALVQAALIILKNIKEKMNANDN